MLLQRKKMADQVVAALVGAFAGMAGTYIAAILKYKKELEAEYDKTLRARRIEAYQALWKCTELFAKYVPPKATISMADLRGFAVALRRWYFETGGMFLTVKSREAYFALMDSLKSLLEREHCLSDDQMLDDTGRETIRQKASDLRTSLVQDVGARRECELGGG
jgi:hypothetical protein